MKARAEQIRPSTTTATTAGAAGARPGLPLRPSGSGSSEPVAIATITQPSRSARVSDRCTTSAPAAADRRDHHRGHADERVAAAADVARCASRPARR